VLKTALSIAFTPSKYMHTTHNERSPFDPLLHLVSERRNPEKKRRYHPE
jgi:hypothetical protein